MSTGGGAKSIIAAFLANVGIAFAKLFGFLVTGSSSMLAESVHSLADSGNQGLLLLGRRRSTRAPDDQHHFGYGRERFFWAFVVAMVLFSLGSLFSIYEAVHKIEHPEEIKSPMVAIGILLVAMVLEAWSFRTAFKEAREISGRQSLVRFIRRTRVPELPVVLLEDLGALIGLVIATGALLLAWKVDPIWDGYGTLLIGILLGVIAVVLAIETKSLLVGEAATPEDLELIRSSLESGPSVERIIHLRTEHIGPEEILLATKVAFAPGIDIAQLAAAIDACEAAVRAAVPSVTLIFIEPDLDPRPGDDMTGAGDDASAAEPATRDRIVAAALEVFVEKGYSGARVQDIAARAGLTAGALYVHFPNRSRLLAEAITVEGNRIVSGLIDELGQRQRGEQRLAATLTAQMVGESALIDRLLIESFALATRDEASQEQLDVTLGLLDSFIGAAVTDSAERGLLASDLDPEAVTAFFSSWIIGMIVRRAVGRPRPDADPMLAVTVRLLDGLAPPEEP